MWWTGRPAADRPGGLAERGHGGVQDFVRFELSLREKVDRGGQADDAAVRAALVDAGADQLADLDTPLAKGYTDGTDLSGGQWQRVALARALCAVRRGARLVLLDEPTAQLDVRGEAAVFDRVLTATRDATTILISHRFSTVRHADRICVLEHGRVVEQGSHAVDGPRRPLSDMFELQAVGSRPHGRGGRGVMSSDSPVAQRGRRRLPPALASMWRLCKIGYTHEPRLVVVVVAVTLLARCRMRCSRSGWRCWPTGSPTATGRWSSLCWVRWPRRRRSAGCSGWSPSD